MCVQRRVCCYVDMGNVGIETENCCNISFVNKFFVHIKLSIVMNSLHLATRLLIHNSFD